MQVKRLIKFGSIGLVIVGAIAITGEASAQSVGPPPVSKFYTTVDGVTKTNLLLVGTPRTQVPLFLSGENLSGTKQVKVNGCGHYILNNANTYNSIALDGAVPLNPNTPLGNTVQPVPNCNNGVSTSNASFINLGDNTLLINIGDKNVSAAAAAAPNGRLIDFAYTQTTAKSKFVTLNKCGLAKVVLKPSTSEIQVGFDGADPVSVDTLVNTGAVPFANCIDEEIGIQTGVQTNETWQNEYGDFYYKTTPNAVKSFLLPGGGVVNKTATSDRCGGLTLGSITKPQTDAFTLNGTVINPSVLPVGLKPNCVVGTNGLFTYDVTPSGNLKTSDGRVFIKSVAANPSGFGDRTIQNYTMPSSNRLKPYTADTCGMIRVKQTTPAFEVITDDAGDTYTMSNLGVRSTTCFKSGGVAVIYRSLLY